MKIHSADYTISAVSTAQYPTEILPEFLFMGRSNVGKSSFINMILNRKNLARTSSKPGKTQAINFYLINEAFYFVDVPGYGYAKVSKKQREQFGKMIEEYLTTRDNLKFVCLLIDFRHGPTEDDILMYNFLKYYDLKTVVVATKADKVRQKERHKARKMIEKKIDFVEGDEFIEISSVTGQNKEVFQNLLTKNLNK